MRLGRERPRKSAGAGGGSVCAARGFNEAGARTPQKGPQASAWSRPPDRASMRLGRERPRKAAHYNNLQWRANFARFQEGASVAPIIKPERAGQAIHDVKYPSKTNALTKFERPPANLRHRAARNRPAVSPASGGPASPSRRETPPATAIISRSRSAPARKTSCRCWSRPDRSCRPGPRR